MIKEYYVCKIICLMYFVLNLLSNPELCMQGEARGWVHYAARAEEEV